MPLGFTNLNSLNIGEIIMTSLVRRDSLFPTLLAKREIFPFDFEKMFIGLDRLYEDLDFFSDTYETKYPPYNLIHEDEDHYTVEMAVAGFAPEDISVTSKNGILSISATRKGDEQKEKDNYVYRGLASRSFKQDFKLYEHVTVAGVEFDNGILRVKLARILPDHLKEHTFPVVNNKQLDVSTNEKSK